MTLQKRKTRLLPYFLLGFMASFMELSIPGVMGTKPTPAGAVPSHKKAVKNISGMVLPPLPKSPVPVTTQNSVKESPTLSNF